MIRTALDGAGGADYLQRQAIENPTAFLGLVGKIVPKVIDGDLTGDIVIQVVTGVPRPAVSEVSDG
jgi:hypothetical protein